MAKDYVVIKGQANIIRNETAEGGNTAAEVGGAIYDVADKLEEVDGTLTSAIGTKLPTSSVVDNLTSTHTTAPLSANQGKVLNDNKADKTTQVVAGNGLTGGGSLSGDVTVNVGNTDDSIVVGADGIKVDTQNSLTSTSTTKPLSAAQGKALQDNKAEKTRNIVAGAGLTGGGDLTADMTINVATADDSLIVAADNIKVNTNNTLTSTSTTQPLSANQGKVLNEKVAQVETDLNVLINDVDESFNQSEAGKGYILISGAANKTATGYIRSYEGIELKKGHTIYVAHTSGTTTISTISTNTDKYATTGFVSKVAYKSSVPIASYTAENDCYVYICRGVVEGVSTIPYRIVYESRVGLLEKDKLSLSKSNEVDLILKSVDTTTYTTKNEVLFPCFVRNTSDLSSLNLDYKLGYKRKLKYQAFKGLKLYGFDLSKKYKLNALWVDSYGESHYYRLIIDQWNGTSWATYFNSGNLTKESLGVQDGKIFKWDQTIGMLRVVAYLDFSNLATGDNTILNAGEPDLIINPECLFDQFLSKESDVEFKSLKIDGYAVSPLSIQNISGNKPYYNSRRKPTFAFIWDDLNTTDELVFSIFQEYGFLPSFALISNNLNANNAPEYQNYYMKGCTILAHSISHPAMYNTATITYEEVDNQMKTSKKIIESYGIRVSGWVTPQSSLHLDFFQLMVKNFGYGFTGLNGGLFNSTVDPLKLSRYGIESAMANHDHTTIINRIDSAISNNELVVFYGHKLPSTYMNGDSTPYVTEDDLRFVLSYLKTKTEDNLCQVLSCDEAIYQYYKQPFA